MRHRNRRGKLGKKSEHRNMMLRNMATSLFDKERIKTTMPKAKELRPFAEKLITLAKSQSLASRRLTSSYITDKRVVKKLYDEIAKRFSSDNGGYTRIVPYRNRWGDGAEEAFLELKNPALPDQKTEKEEKGKTPAKEAKSEKKKSKASAAEKEEVKEEAPKKKKATKAKTEDAE